MTTVLTFIEDTEKRLSREREIHDLEDIRLIMIAVKDLRENEIRIDMNITPIEESYAILQTHNINIAREEIERSETLRYRWGKLQHRCVR
jgi:dynein heavy chain